MIVLCIFVHSNLFRHGKITHITLRLSLIFQLNAEQQYNHCIYMSYNRGTVKYEINHTGAPLYSEVVTPCVAEAN